MEVGLYGLSVSYGKKTIIDKLTATVASGELVALFGPSGCGKSTTLLAVAGLLEPSAGTVRYDGRIVNSIKTEHRNIGLVFQQYSLYPHMTVFDNIAFPLRMKKRPKPQIRQRVGELAEALRIEPLLSRKPHQLSGGQQQRVAIARAIAKPAELLLLDEPFSNLDAALRLELREEFRALQRRLGITTLFVTHDQEEAMSISDRMMVMAEGRLLQYDTPERIYRRPLSRRVAEIAGHPPMSFLQAEGESRVMGVRAEDWQLVDPESALFAGTVVAAERSAREQLVKVRAGSQLIRAFAPHERNVPIGGRVGLAVRPERVHWFDAASGRRIEPNPDWPSLKFAGMSHE